MTAELPQFVRDLLASPPKAGEGIHSYLFRLARVLHPLRDEGVIADLLRANTADCGRVVPESEIQAAVQNSRSVAWQPGQPTPIHAPPAWPAVNKDQLRKEVLGGIALVDLWEESPIRFEDNDSHTEEIIDALFQGNPLLCCGESNAVFATRQREDWRGKLNSMQFIVPSPMRSETGLAKAGHESEHTLASTGARRFLVIECDYSEKNRAGTQDTALAPLVREFAYQGISVADMCAAVLCKLAESCPLALVVHSGGKSLHGWFYVAGRPEDHARYFMRQAVQLGADPATWTRSQFVRMPDGTRDNGARQVVYFFNPQCIK